MKPLREFDTGSICALLTDLDDTVTDGPQVRPGAFKGLCDLKAAGLKIAIVSGRPAGWADCLIRLWPIDAMIFENGAGFVHKTGQAIERVEVARGQDLAHTHRLLDEALSKVRQEFPDARLSGDQKFRLYDYAIDVAEDGPRLPAHVTARMLEILSSFPDITAKLSSIHINFWKGTHTKLDACRILLSEYWRIFPEQAVYCGDSPNDEPMFAHFANSIGVANVIDYASVMPSLPTYVTNLRRGSGFEEICAHLLTHQHRS